MAVLIEAISVVIRADRLLARMAWDDFAAMVPNGTLCADDELIRVGFMHPEDVRDFVERLEERGLRYLESGASVDLVVVDQQTGPMARCGWIEFGSISLGSQESHLVSAARMVGSSCRQVLTPDGWRYEGSLSQTFGLVPMGREEASLEFKEERGGTQVFRSKLTGRDVFVSRTRPIRSCK
jgi:hypothetical protein